MTLTRAFSRRSFLVAGLAFSLGLWGLTDALAHKFFVVLTRVSDNPRAETIEVIHRFFTHDILIALENYAGHSVTMEDYSEAELLLGAYVEENFSLQFDNQPVALTYLGMEVESEFTWAYLEGPLNKIPEIAEVTNRLLIREFEGQINTVTLVFNERSVRSANFDQDNHTFLLEIKAAPTRP